MKEEYERLKLELLRVMEYMRRDPTQIEETRTEERLK
jgi:hypothetical protein